MTADPRERYVEGVGLWAERDLAGAIEILTSVVDSVDAAPGDGWWFSASRALAQIALESDDADEAELHLRRLEGTGVSDAQTLALRGRREFQMGDDTAAIADIHGAVIRLSDDHSDDVGSLMNGAMALIWSAEILTELGYSADASTLATRALMRMRAAGVDNPVMVSMLNMVDSSLAALACDSHAAGVFMDRVDTTQSPDFRIRILRDRARIASSAGRAQDAAELYDRSLKLAQENQYAFLVRSISVEKETGPPARRSDHAPVGSWDPRAMENVPVEHVPYAVVIRLPVRDEFDLHDLGDRIAAVLEADATLGYVDGTGTDGEVWEIFLEGSDPNALWDAIRPLIEASPLWRYAEISKREGSESYRFRLSSGSA